MHRVIAGCETMYFSMSVSDDYLAATVNTAAVAKHHGVKAFINMSQMTLSQMSITETTTSPQERPHGRPAGAELVWSAGRAPAADSVFRRLLPDFHPGFGQAIKSNKTTVRRGQDFAGRSGDVACVVAVLLANPQPHIGKSIT